MDSDQPSTRGLHIMMIAPTSFFSDYGGHIRIYEEALILKEMGHHITIVTYYKGRDLPELDIRRTAPLPYRTEYEVGSSRHKIAFDIYLSIKSLRVALKERPDVIHAHMHEGALIGAVLSRWLGIPLIFDYQGSLTAEMLDHKFIRPGGLRLAILHRLEKWINFSAEAILTSSIQARHMLEADFGMPKGQIVPLPDCVDISRFNPADIDPAERQKLRNQYGIPDDADLVVYLGLLTDYQGIPHMLRAAKLLKDRETQRERPVYFLIMGFPSVNHYKNVARELDISDRVIFTGKVPYKDAPSFLSVGDIAITAKMSSTEGSGKMLNYMAMELPIVAYDTPVHREYLGELGMFVPVGDIEELAATIEAALIDRSRLKPLGRELRERVIARFTWPVAGRIIDGLYRKLTGTM